MGASGSQLEASASITGNEGDTRNNNYGRAGHSDRPSLKNIYCSVKSDNGGRDTSNRQGFGKQEPRGACFSCGEYGHWAYRCRQRQQNVGKTEVVSNELKAVSEVVSKNGEPE